MSDLTIISQLEPVFADVLDVPGIRLTRATTAADVDGWDSLAHINLVVAIERRFNIKFKLGELQELQNVGEMVDLIAKKTGS